MIKGKKIPQYDEFEQSIVNLIGSIYYSDGLEFYFYCIKELFNGSENEIQSRAKAYENDLKDMKLNDPEVWWSIVSNDPEHERYRNPLLHILRQSYFINVHSELEVTWKEIIALYNKQALPEEMIKDGIVLNLEKLNGKELKKGSLLHTCICSNSLLLTYNHIRNKIVHQSWEESETDRNRLKDIEMKISEGEIRHFEIDRSGKKAKGIIKNIAFIADYEQLALKFLRDIVESSYNTRIRAEGLIS